MENALDYLIQIYQDYHQHLTRHGMIVPEHLIEFFRRASERESFWLTSIAQMECFSRPEALEKVVSIYQIQNPFTGEPTLQRTVEFRENWYIKALFPRNL